MQEFLNSVPDYLDVASKVIASASVISAGFGYTRTTGLLAGLRVVINAFALNFGHVKNIKPANPTVVVGDK